MNDKIVWLRDAKVYCGYYSNIVAKMQVVYNSKNYDIVDFGDVDEANNHMVLMLKMRED